MTKYLSTPDWTAHAWNAQAAREQANRAMKAEQERDAMVAAIARLSGEITALEQENAELRQQIAAMEAFIRGYES